MRVAQRAIDLGVGAERYGGENLDYYVASQFQNRQNDTTPYSLTFNNCKENAADLLRDARSGQRDDQRNGRQNK